MPSANDIQHGGDHYKGAKFQHWDLMAKCRIGYLEGCATKYASRWRKKNGVEDLKKAIHYVDKILECVEDYDYRLAGCAMPEDLDRFFAENNIENVWEISAISLLCTWRNKQNLMRAKADLERLLDIANHQLPDTL